jgi:hypothetical protein
MMLTVLSLNTMMVVINVIFLAICNQTLQRSFKE